MNYSNTPLRPDRSASMPERGPETVLSIETDKRGTHLRLRKLDTVRRRARSSLAITASLLVFGLSVQAQFIIDQTTSLFSPSFRDTLTLDAGNTTWFGWTGNNDGVAPSADDGGFDGSNANELIDNPFGNFCVTRMSQVHTPSRLILVASAHYVTADEDYYGYHTVEPPHLRAQTGRANTTNANPGASATSTFATINKPWP